MSGGDQTILVTGSDLETLAADLKTANAKIAQRLEDLTADLKKIFGAGWEGVSRAAFDDAHRQWSQQMTEMQQIMIDAHNNVITSRENYAAGDKKAAGFF